MSGHEAALMASQLPLGVAIPCHYGMWAPEGYGAHPGQDPAAAPTLDPRLFADTLARLGGPQARVLELGERFTIQSGP
jgi:L-ascorbate metabolism protein UlaG (beta-lactamase superfamily)